MPNFKDFFTNPQTLQALRALSPVLFGAFGGPAMGQGASNAIQAQDEILRQQQAIEEQRRQRESQLGIQVRGQNIQLAGQENQANIAANRLEADRNKQKSDSVKDAFTVFQNGLAGIDTSDEQAMTGHALNVAKAMGLSLDDTVNFLSQAQTRSKLKPAKPPTSEVYVGPKGEIGTGSAFESGVGQSFTGLSDSLVAAESRRRGGGEQSDTRYQRVDIFDPERPGQSKIALFDPRSGQVYDKDTKAAIPNARMYKSPGEQTEPIYPVFENGQVVYRPRSQASGMPAPRQIFDPSGNVTMGGQVGYSTTAPTQFTESVAADFTGSLDTAGLMKKVQDQIATGQAALGPVIGRLKLFEIEKAGGSGATPEQIKSAIVFRKLLLNQAFSQGGKQLTPTERDEFVATLPAMSDTFNQAAIKLRTAHQYLIDHVKNKLSVVPQNTLRQYPNLLKKLIVVTGDTNAAGAGKTPADEAKEYLNSLKK